MVKRLEPYMAGEKEPRLKNYYILIFPGGGTIGVRPLDPSKIDELGKVVNEEITAGFPDLNVFAQQGNLFGGFGDGRNIEVRLQSADFDALLESARKAQDVIIEKMPGARGAAPSRTSSSPSRSCGSCPDDRRISESGWTRANVATVVRALGDGIWVGEHFDGERRLDMILRAQGWDSPDALAAVPVATPTGGVVPLGELVAHRADRQLHGPPARGRPPHDRHQRRRAARHVAAAGDGEARDRSRPGDAAAAAAGRRHPLRRRRGQPRDRARGHARQHLAGAARAVPADGRAVPLGEGQRCW